MTRNTAIRLLLLQTALMILLGWATVYLGRDEFRLFSGREEEEVPTASHVEDEGGMPVVQLSSAAIREVGIEYAKASATELAPQSTVGVTVLDPQPLVELRGRLQAAALDLQAAQAAANASRAGIRACAPCSRMIAMPRSVPRNRLPPRRRRMRRGDKAPRPHSNRCAPRPARRGVRRSPAGSTAPMRLASTVSHPERTACCVPQCVRKTSRARPACCAFRCLAARNPLPPSRSAPHRKRTRNWVAAVCSTAFLPPNCAPGMRLSGSLSRGHRLREGALVPSAAIVWHTGKPWIYLREADEKKEDASEFRRRDVSGGEAMGTTGSSPAWRKTRKSSCAARRYCSPRSSSSRSRTRTMTDERLRIAGRRR